MKRFAYEQLPAWLLIGVFGLIVIHAPLTVAIGTLWPDIATPIKAWKEVLIGLAGVLVAIRMTQRGHWQMLRYDYLGWAILAYWGLHIGSIAWTDASWQSIAAGLLIDLRYLVFAACIYHFVLMYPKYIPRFIKVSVVGAAIVVGFAALQLVLPADALKYIGYSDSTIAPYLTVDKNPDYVRLNSTLRGPNPLGAYAVIVVAAAASFIGSKQYKFGSTRLKTYGISLLGLGSLALWMSYSRSALVAGMVAVALVLFVRYSGRLSAKVWAVIVAAVLAVGAMGYLIRDTTFVQNVVLHDNPTTGAAVDSNEDHASSLQEGLMRALDQPFGAGVGTTGSASLYGNEGLIIENQYLMIAHEVGWLGLALFMIIYLTFLRRIWHYRADWLALGIWASGIGLGLIGLLLPVWADDTVALVWWGLAALVMARGELHESTTDKKAKRTT